MKCYITILRYMRLMGGDLDTTCLSIIGPTEPFSTKIDSQNCWQNANFQVPSQYRKWDVELQREISIADEVFQNLPEMH